MRVQGQNPRGEGQNPRREVPRSLWDIAIYYDLICIIVFAWVGKAMNILAMETSIFDREDHSPYLSLIAKIVFNN